MPPRKRDRLYQQPLNQLADFEFNQHVVDVFEDMINRSVPGYGTIVHSLRHFAQLFVQDNSYCYDLGCSLGAGALSIQSGLDDKQDVTIFAIDNSQQMLERAAHFISQSAHSSTIKLQHDNVLDSNIQNASLVTLNFILQFIAPDNRDELLKKIYAGMNAGACLILSEKICFDHEPTQQLITQLHHRFKSEHGYSDLEIAQKRDSLENVMRVDTQTQHLERLQKTGFSHIQQWYQNTAFVSFYAIK